MSRAQLSFPSYDTLGVRPLINCRGTYTILSGSLLLPAVRQAMSEASKRYVNLDELMAAVGTRIAALMQVEWGLVTSGCAAALCQVTAACVAGSDPEKMARLPDTAGMKNEVVIPAEHRHVYDHAIRMVGVKMVDVASRSELEEAVGENTAMFAFKGDMDEQGAIPLRELAAFGRERGIPTLVDAAAERPYVPNRYLEAGADLVAYSGGKCLRGPQASGLVMGRKDLLEAAFLNGAPHHALGRPMKAGKEEIMGLLAAVEQWVERDHRAEWREWERRLEFIGSALRHIKSLQYTIKDPPSRSNVAPSLIIEWDGQVVNLKPAEVEQALSEGEPRIELFSGSTGIEILPYMMEVGEDEIVAARLKEILEGAT